VVSMSPQHLQVGSRVQTASKGWILNAQKLSLHLRGGMPQAEAGRTVIFKRLARLEEGEKLYVSGDSAALGENVPANAVQMILAADGKTWHVEVKDVPIGARYKYIAANPTDLTGTNRPTAHPDYKLQVHEPQGQSGSGLEMDNTVSAVSRRKIMSAWRR